MAAQVASSNRESWYNGFYAHLPTLFTTLYHSAIPLHLITFLLFVALNVAHQKASDMTEMLKEFFIPTYH